jgi:hypothetical protein
MYRTTPNCQHFDPKKGEKIPDHPFGRLFELSIDVNLDGGTVVKSAPRGYKDDDFFRRRRQA